MSIDYPEKLAGVKMICSFLQWSPAKLYRHMKEMKNSGLLFYDKIGQPPHKTVCAFKTMIYTWVSLKARKGETL